MRDIQIILGAGVAIAFAIAEETLGVGFSLNPLDRICWGRMSFGAMIKLKDLATLTIAFDAEEEITFRISIFPAGPFRIKKGRAVDMNASRTI